MLLPGLLVLYSNVILAAARSYLSAFNFIIVLVLTLAAMITLVLSYTVGLLASVVELLAVFLKQAVNQVKLRNDGKNTK